MVLLVVGVLVRSSRAAPDASNSSLIFKVIVQDEGNKRTK